MVGKKVDVCLTFGLCYVEIFLNCNLNELFNEVLVENRFGGWIELLQCVLV